ncbi:MAG: DUF6518 family protein [Pseudonocardiales bacterium]
MRPLAHVFGIWIVLAVALSVRQNPRHAMFRTTVELVTAVIAFYVGKKIMYGIEYPGMPYSLNMSTLGLWCILATIGGPMLGLLFFAVGRRGWHAAAATAAALALLLADVYRRASNYGDQAPVLLILATAGVVTILALADKTAPQLARTAILVAPMAVLSYGLVSAPDLVEQLILMSCWPAISVL